MHDPVKPVNFSATHMAFIFHDDVIVGPALVVGPYDDEGNWTEVRPKVLDAFRAAGIPVLDDEPSAASKKPKATELDPYQARVEAERLIGEDRVPTDVLLELIEQYGEEGR